MQSLDSTSERRWIVLGADGRHTTLGRQAPPTNAEIYEVEQKMSAASIEGWIASLDGDYWCKEVTVDLAMIKPLANPSVEFEAAVEAFKVRRKAAISLR